MENSNLQTPPRNNYAVTLPPDTVSVDRHTSRTSYRTGDLRWGRMAVVADIGRVLTVPLDRLTACINETPSVDLEQACDAIMRDVDGTLFSKETGKIQWKGFPTPPSSSNFNEDKAFRPIVDVFDAVFANVRGCGLSLVMNGHSTPGSERGNKSRPDAFLIRSRNRAMKTSNHWNDVAVPFEFKKDVRDKHDNHQKIIWNLHCIMREDPCRRFAFGITIEDSSLRLWLSNRAFLAVSQPIDFLQEVERTIRLFTFLAWASVASDMEGLGWDPTVKRLGDKPVSWQYEFKVGNETFTTTKAIATYGADSMVGRGTRVYEAKDSKGNTVAIKDSWRDADRKLEGEILEDILKSCDRKLTKEEAAEAKKAFVEIKLYGDVYASDRRDETYNPMKGMSEITWENIELEPVKKKSTYLSSIVGYPDSGRAQSTKLHRVQRTTGVPRRVHTRTIFSEVGVSLQALTNLKTYLSTLKDAARALYLLHRAGWVHRDFSGGNVIRISDRGKLGDFEYAKEVDSGYISHDVRTGTLKFMAVEVEQHEYLFMSHRVPRATPQPVFRANFLHDFESLWWAFAWVLFYHTDKNSDDQELAKRQHQEFQRAFPDSMEVTTRLNFFTHPQILDRASETLCATCRPPSVDLWSFLVALIDHYNLAEISYPKIEATPELLEGLYEKVSTNLQHAVDCATDIELCPVESILCPKRSRDDEESLTGPVEKKAHRC